MKKPIYKRWWFWLIAVIVVVGAIGSIKGGGDKNAVPAAANAEHTTIVESTKKEIESAATAFTFSMPPMPTTTVALQNSLASNQNTFAATKAMATERENTSPPSATKALAAIYTDPPQNITAAKVLRIVSAPNEVSRNEEFHTVSIIGKSNTEYTIQVKYASGTISKAEGLDPHTTDANGCTSWTWKIGGRTNPGESIITIRGGEETVTHTFVVVPSYDE